MFLIVLENHSYAQIVGSRDTPFLDRLAHTAGVAADYEGVAHPSEPNYLALVSGSTHGVTSDAVTSVRAPSLADQVTWRSYMQSDRKPEYALKHDPFRVLGERSEDWRRFAHDPLAQFTLIVPDLCHDMHGAPGCYDEHALLRAGDGFVREAVRQIERRWTPGSVIFITFDEGEGDQHVLTLVIRRGGRHAVSHRRYTHYALLHTVERYLGVPCLALACKAPVMRDLVPAGG